jgi:RNA polymerase sigma-54 factor
MQSYAGLELRQSRSLVMTEDLRTAIGLLRLRNHELAEAALTAAQTNPHLHISTTRRAVGLSWLDSFRHTPPDIAARARNGGVGTGTGAAGGTDDWLPAASPGLIAHVQGQISLLIRNPAHRPIAQAYLAALEPSGWLSQGPAEIARTCGCTVDVAELVLGLLQQADPTGLFARSLAECLRLQAMEADVLAADFALLLDNLDLLADRQLDQLAVRCGCGADRLQAMIRTLRGMNPKPGAAFSDEVTPITEPDLIVCRDHDRWMIELNRSTLPAIEVVPLSATAGAAESLHKATALVRAIQRRNTTVLRVATAAIGWQMGFVAQGGRALRPLTFADIADMTGLHVSTISRVTSNLLIALPRKTISFRDLFSAACAPDIARTQVLDEIRAMIAAENPFVPITDDAITARLARTGVVLSRRTVAKFRAELGIPGAPQRRGQAVPGPAA